MVYIVDVLVDCTGGLVVYILVDYTGGLFWWTVDPSVDVWDVVRVGVSDSRRYLLYGAYLGRRDKTRWDIWTYCMVDLARP